MTIIWSGIKTYVGGSAECTTDVNGECSVMTGDEIPKNNDPVTFIVDSVTHVTMTYDPTANHDADGDSDGTSITISKP